ncbi:membrane-bound metal-dependent hydrolase YbcI (DUF457 family) [Paucibacter oligotrophus]|uniref:Membrane-bound metal-dependent hydrolase YbcI (DUF457 family) n=1 Tax=Roseateles oligotrophus TaxID=1769250 RepID=A0A840L4A0_9BURK|nr:hypothetical protein [Roseateles oligotrophus]MBB4841663.1 membrane-bound metal-dependent hydrolase YbcI (DUF457 family) [Roseateles oligotrophus]
MPITPFHFGLGAALHGAAPKTVSFLSFCAANVLIDLEVLYKLMQRQHPLHAFFHTYIGATLVMIATICLFMGMRWFAARFWLPDLLSWRSLAIKPVALGAGLGAYTHIVLDSIMHTDIRPFAPFSEANGLHGLISLTGLHLLCMGLGLFGLAALSLRRLRAKGDKT